MPRGQQLLYALRMQEGPLGGSARRDPGDSAVIPRGGAPFGPRHMEPQVFVSRAAASSGKTQESECLSSSETLDFGPALTELEGPGPRFFDEAPRPPGDSGATYRSRRAAGAAQTRIRSPTRRSRGAARPSGIARPGLGANAPRVAARGVPGPQKIVRVWGGRGRGAAPKSQQSHPLAGLRVCAAGPGGARR